NGVDPLVQNSFRPARGPMGFHTHTAGRMTRTRINPWLAQAIASCILVASAIGVIWFLFSRGGGLIEYLVLIVPCVVGLPFLALRLAQGGIENWPASKRWKLVACWLGVNVVILFLSLVVIFLLASGAAGAGP